MVPRASSVTGEPSELPEPTMTTHPLACRTADAYLAMAEAVAPGLVEALYLIGSAALNDFRPAWSDLDFVAVTPAPPDEAALSALAEGHARLDRERSMPTLDGIYATWDELRAGPLAVPAGPCVEDGRFVAMGCHERHPMTWSVLRSDAVTARGPLSAGAGIWRDPAALERWILSKIDDEWRPWLARGIASRSSGGADLLDPTAVERSVLSLCRLHYTLATGVVPSKSDAGLYGLIALPAECHRIIDEALRIRREPDTPTLYAIPEARRDDLIGFARIALDDAVALGVGERRIP